MAATSATTAAKKVVETAVQTFSKAGSLTQFGVPSLAPRGLRKDPKSRLPVTPTKVVLHEYAPSRYEDHYYTTVRDDVMYMNYTHERVPRPPRREIRLKFDPEDPYSKYRKNFSVGGDAQVVRELPPPDTPENVTRLERIQIHTMVKQAVQSRQELVGAIMAVRALSGETSKGGGLHAVEGVQITKGKRPVGGWIRPNIPVGAKVDLKGHSMYEFMSTLVDFVLPRLRDFDGVELPYAGSNMHKMSSVSGVVAMGLPPEAMQFFPQIEVNYGMHIHFVTNATGVGAQDRARALLSGFQIPFTRTSR
ncbi:60s ribosomal protein l7 [Hymenopellis radicata]|nr:60s ribosomal protein l7 [Hymenopellis radicata]